MEACVAVGAEQRTLWEERGKKGMEEERRERGRGGWRTVGRRRGKRRGRKRMRERRRGGRVEDQ